MPLLWQSAIGGDMLDDKFFKKTEKKMLSLKLDEDVINNFKNACKSRNVSMSKVLEELMRMFIESTEHVLKEEVIDVIEKKKGR